LAEEYQKAGTTPFDCKFLEGERKRRQVEFQMEKMQMSSSKKSV
jgi:hypothetical protein